MAEFLDMGGYGVYVWLSYGVTMLFVLICIGHSFYRAWQIKKHAE